ncbi:hypothetical protein CQA66_05725 [Helicobacter aurati]|uniref:Type II secretion system protein n=1 Tax=Helicobacter aurati TaxID=137778 RepID=A0A3D8J3A6_9HELI|nr:hypothetical protein [Helicobacter aurati]RDU71959.1 hypothetical protein CQA66_05725 [Helicobacter aurati]
MILRLFLQISKCFSFFELSLCLFIVSILCIPVMKYFHNNVLALERASLHIQILQKRLSAMSYQHYLKAQDNVSLEFQAILQQAITQNKFFSFQGRGKNQFRLTIGKEYAQFTLVENPKGIFALTCNPSQRLCRKIYHRKHTK